MAKVRELINENGDTIGYVFYCPGCKCRHHYYVNKSLSDAPGKWVFNGNVDNPTFTPSLVNTTGSYAEPSFIDPPEIPPTRCHLYVTNGVIVFCGDSTHELAGKSVAMADFP